MSSAQPTGSPQLALRIEPGGNGTRITDQRTGLAFVLPDGVTVFAGRPASPQGPAFDFALRLFSLAVELRLALVSHGPGDVLEPQHALRTCHATASSRAAAPAQPMAARPEQLRAWQVDQAASAIYPLQRADDGLDYEECMVLTRASAKQTVVITKRFSTRALTPPIWADFNGRFAASLAWGASLPVAAPSASFFVDGGMSLLPDAIALAERVAAELVREGVSREVVEGMAQHLGRVVHTSEPPDARIDPQLPQMLEMTVLGNGPPAARLKLKAIVTEKVVTHRDLRGFHVFLEKVASAMAQPAAAQPPPAAATPPGPAYRLSCGADLGSGVLPVFPVLMRETWERAPTQVCRPLIVGPKLREIPVVALAHLIPQPGSEWPGRAYIRQERVQSLGKTPSDFEQEALYNLSQRPGSLKPTDMGGKAKVAVFEGDYLAAERILDAATLQRVHELLGEKSFVVGVPARAQFFATGFSHFAQGLPEARAFKSVVERMFAEGGEAAIAPWLFLVIEGRLNSILEVQ